VTGTMSSNKGRTDMLMLNSEASASVAPTSIIGGDSGG